MKILDIPLINTDLALIIVLINLDLDLLPADLKLIMDPHVVP
jgi:hypothetical protein